MKYKFIIKLVVQEYQKKGHFDLFDQGKISFLLFVVNGFVGSL